MLRDTRHASVWDAYTNAQTGDVIELMGMTTTENLHLNTPTESISLKGGYDCNFRANKGYTTIIGSLEITVGTVTVERIVIQ
jgi:hypothetical protein